MLGAFDVGETITQTIDVERGLVAHYLYRILSSDAVPLRSKRYILYWLNDRTEMLSLRMPQELAKSIGNIYGAGVNISAFEAAYQKHHPALLKLLKNAGKNAGRSDPVYTNIKRISKAFHFQKSSKPILRLIAFAMRYEQLQYLCHCVNESISPANRAFSILCDVPMPQVDQMLGPQGDLVTAGLLNIKMEALDLVGLNGRFTLSKRLNHALDYHYKSFEGFRRALLGNPVSASIDLDDYAHIHKDRDLACALLKGASRDQAAGINVLLYGEPGAGKTELTKVAAQAAGLSLYSAGDDSHAAGETDRQGRLRDLVLSVQLMKGMKNVAILFDEMEDIAVHLIKRGGSKLYLNRLLESNHIPILWTSNNIDDIDNAVLRRMTLAIELKHPPVAQRTKILSRMVERMGLEIEPNDIGHLAHQLDASPAIMENALRVAKYSSGGVKQAAQAAGGISKIITGSKPPKLTQDHKFDLRLVRTNTDLKALTKRLKTSKNTGFSMCLSGPPGTGKSAYGRHMANKLGLDVIQQRASDIFSPYVGETEKRIAAVFEEARTSGSCLIFDEADSFLFDRNQAVRSFEVSQVNEMLTWMEQHPFPVIFTTNLMGFMDQASLRRFTFHIAFNYLNEKGVTRAYKRFFKLDDIPQMALGLTNLTPGDFAQARRQASVLGVANDGEAVTGLLHKLSEAKPDQERTIGFVK